MFDRFFLLMLGVAAVAAVGLAMVWPQGLGDRSPGPFGSTPVQRQPAMQAAMKRETLASEPAEPGARGGPQPAGPGDRALSMTASPS